MSESITVAFDTLTSEELQTRHYEYIQSIFPNWKPEKGNLEVAQTEEFTQLIFELLTLAADVPPEILAYLGTIIKIEQEEAVAATVTSTWTMIDNLGHTIPADTIVAWAIADDQLVGFKTVSEVTVPPLSTATTAGQVLLQADVAGVSGNGFSGNPQLINLLDFVDHVTAVGTTSGGVEAEPFSDYLNRLSTRLQLLRDGVVRADDLAIWVATVFPEITGRVLGFDLYDGATGTPDVERHASVVVTGVDGLAMSAPNKDAILAALDLTREVGFVFHVLDATYHQIDVQAALVSEQGWDPAIVAANVKESLASALNPLFFARSSSSQDATEWQLETVVRRSWVYAQIVRVEGVRYIDETTIPLALRVDGGSWVATDITLSGLAPLTTSDITDMDITAV